jgi:hypothetical protein
MGIAMDHDALSAHNGQLLAFWSDSLAAIMAKIEAQADVSPEGQAFLMWVYVRATIGDSLSFA